MWLVVRALALALVAASLAACGDGDGDPPTPTPAPETATPATATLDASPAAPGGTATAPAGVSCPFDDDVCAFALDLAGWLETGDIDAILAHSEPTQVTCSGEPTGLDPTLPLCEGAAAGELREGYTFGRLQSEAGMAREGVVAGWLKTSFFGEPPADE